MGDPAGVGPEIVLQFLNDPRDQFDYPVVVFGDLDVLTRCSAATNQPLKSVPVQSLSEFFAKDVGLSRRERWIIDCKCMDASRLVPGQVSALTGDASFRYIQHAIDAALSKRIAAVTTAPINKEALHSAGHHYPGHTEMFAERAGAASACMMQYSPEITCSFVTVHCGYSEVPALLNEERIFEVIELTVHALRKLRGSEPSIVVCGLNPHAGEHGLFGNREEERIIQPAIDRARKMGWKIEGPLPPDTAFIPWKRQVTDAFVCMYHDQGHIPVKALAFDSAVNTTLGISIIRTSVDHGTACDIAWQGKARAHSLRAALGVAQKLVAM